MRASESAKLCKGLTGRVGGGRIGKTIAQEREDAVGVLIVATGKGSSGAGPQHVGRERMMGESTKEIGLKAIRFGRLG